MLLSIKEAAAYLHVCTRTLRRYIGEGKLPFIQFKINGQIFFDQKALDLFITEHTITPVFVRRAA